MYLISVAIVLALGALGMWLRKRYLKKVMEKGLGRKVEDYDLTSISEWMEALPDEQSKNRPRKPFG
ncbi:MAG: hypothetical protein AABM67_19880 [Acidobacteriota bacterium]